MALPDVLALERATLTAVPAPRLAFDGNFVQRAFLGGTGRANSASSLDPGPDRELPERLARIAARYAALGLTPRFRSTPLDPPGMQEMLRARGFVERDETQVLAGPVERLARADAAVEVLERPEPEWLGVVATAEHQVPARRQEKLRMPELLAIPAAWLLLREEGRPAASIFVSADAELGGIFDLAVRPEFRRRGLGARIAAAAAHWAAARGARWLWAQVSSSNTASLGLNFTLGLREAYRYRYLMQVQEPQAPGG
jgi:GNAT superfamily N-acetyltransferase